MQRTLKWLALLATTLAIPSWGLGLAEDCAAIRAANPAAGDGEYIIAPGGHAFRVYCDDMAGSPREYLSLVPEANYSATTRYARVRLDPRTWRVDVADATFALEDAAPAMRYATAASCNGPVDDGRARIDLGAHPFIVQDTFLLRGDAAVGTVNGAALAGDGATMAVAASVVALAAGGSCGVLAPAMGALQLAPTAASIIDTAICKQGGFLLFGVFKTQGDCVAFFASKLRNLPG